MCNLATTEDLIALKGAITPFPARVPESGQDSSVLTRLADLLKAGIYCVWSGFMCEKFITSLFESFPILIMKWEYEDTFEL